MDVMQLAILKLPWFVRSCICIDHHIQSFVATSKAHALY